MAQLESVYRSAAVVRDVCIYADTTKTKPIAVVVPIEQALKSLAEDLGIGGQQHIEEMVHDEKLSDAVLKQLQDTGKRGGLQGIEIVEGVLLTDEEWTPQNGLITSAQKINRRLIVDKFRKDIDRAYAKAVER